MAVGLLSIIVFTLLLLESDFYDVDIVELHRMQFTCLILSLLPDDIAAGTLSLHHLSPLDELSFKLLFF